MEGLEKIKKRINSVTATHKIIFAMQLIASSKIQKFKKTFQVYENYLQGFYNIFVNLYSNPEHDFTISNSLLTKKKKKSTPNKTLWIVIGSDLGMCGNYNHNIIKQMQKNILANDEVYLFGNKLEVLSKNKMPNLKLITNYKKIENKQMYEYISVLADQFFTHYLNNDFSSLKIIYTQYINPISYKVKVMHLFPFNEEYFSTINFNKEKTEYQFSAYELSLSPEKFIAQIFISYLTTILYGSLLESKLSEHSSRYHAMKTAADNASELLENYKLQYNQIRQAIITQDIIEIINGTNQKK